ncbi:MAG TPA: branched-chain amino acid ABC transporter permease [Solirubrobacterales bacterium]|nr:branched-chain amino acid ABC transporter permease [Solirubrobacterales bacterium]
MEKFFQILVSGIAVGGIYAIAALGFVLIFKATRIVNFAQGSLMMLGGYVGYAAVVTWSLSMPIAFIVSAIAIATVGAVIYLLTLRPVASRAGDTSFAQVIITMACTIVIAAVVQYIWGPTQLNMPDIFPSGVFMVGGVRIAWADVGTIGITLAVVVVFTAVFRFTRFGLMMRALADNRQAAVMVGANPDLVSAGAWALAAAVAAIAGMTLTSYGGLNLSFGNIALLAFPAAVLGGIDSIPGALVGGVLIGIVQQLSGGYIDPAFGQTAGFIVMLIVLMLRPNGLFGSPDIARI